MRPGFTIAVSLRLLTSSLAIVIPLYAISLGATPSEAGVFVVLLWLGNGVGAAAATLVVRDQSVSSVGGFLILGASMLVLGLRAPYPPLSLGVLVAGAGMGLPQPLLSAVMHLDSAPERPSTGLGVYSTALGIGLVLGPLVAYGVLELYGFSGVFKALALVSALGVAGAWVGRRGVVGRPKPPVPSMATWARALRRPIFRRAFMVNLLYSLLLPVFLSYGGVYAEERFGFSSGEAFLLFTLVFLASAAIRYASIGTTRDPGRVLMVSAGFLTASAMCVTLAPSWPVFVAGMLLFSIPHAMVFPVANFLAFRSVETADVINASYAFQASSGGAEVLSPVLAIALIPTAGLQGVFAVGAVIAGTAFVLAARRPDGVPGR
ncbi:MAG: MFS transporter [Nitrososphaerota archaeon]|nr:MFS transporter [Nitrososphaerota archaeon]MDG7014064.1 MFS transporter [Nitrososphaerota archaeon]MDG7025406.1 MFS transporter [Nitrososphaerota archaeon]